MLAAALALTLSAAPGVVGCRMIPGDAAWVQLVERGWPRVRARALHAAARPLPRVVLFDARCSYRRNPGAGTWRGAPHDGQVPLPNGTTIAVAPEAAFSQTTAGGDYLVMALPSVWRVAIGPAKPGAIPLERELEGIFMHEAAHALHAAVAPATALGSLRGSGAGTVDDDAIQDRLGNDRAFAAAVAAERDALLAGVTATTDVGAGRAACRANALIAARRDRWFTGPRADWRRIYEVALTTEGLGQWASYAWLTRFRALPAARVRTGLRSPYWSQDVGLAGFLLIDRLVPGWQRLLLRRDRPLVMSDLLARACRQLSRTTRRNASP